MDAKKCLSVGMVAWAICLLPCCGYHLGGLKARELEGMQTFCVNMFANRTPQPMVSQQLTTALTDAMQRDGSYRLASPAQADFTVEGEVYSITSHSLTTSSEDTYISTELGLTVTVHYRITNNRSGEVIITDTATGEGSYFNISGNSQSARDNALSFATRRVAEKIVNQLTWP